MKNLEQGIKSFSSEFGTDPPSFVILYETARTGPRIPMPIPGPAGL